MKRTDPNIDFVEGGIRTAQVRQEASSTTDMLVE